MLSLKNVMTHLNAAPNCVIEQVLQCLDRLIVCESPLRGLDLDYVWILIMQRVPAEFLLKRRQG
jgi:hypothetical protein